MNRIYLLFLAYIPVCIQCPDAAGQVTQRGLVLDGRDYFHMPGLEVTVFSDYYPEGHQSGLTVIQHGNRVAANGDLRLEPSPGQWSPVPAAGEREVDAMKGRISQTMWFPDSARDRRGFNPVIYPDLSFTYHIQVTALERNSFRVTVDLEEPVPDEWTGRVGFNLELFPGDLFGKAFLVDEQSGIFPDQPVGPMVEQTGVTDEERQSLKDVRFGSPASSVLQQLTRPLGSGRTLVIAPEDPLQRMVIESRGEDLELWDGRSNHNNGWFIVRGRISKGKRTGVIDWIVTPNVVEDWRYTPVIQVSQIGYHPGQKKKAIVEQDTRDSGWETFTVFRLGNAGREVVMHGSPQDWGTFLRYRYVTLDFTEITSPGMYQVSYGGQVSHPFRIATDIYSRNTWQPTLEYYLPVQMCHMRVNEKYRVWHDLCHTDDALMAPPTPWHFDGYRQEEDNLTRYRSLEAVAGLDHGGWHDAGDFDLRVESQAGTVRMLALMVEEFGLDHDATTIDQENRLVEIHRPDGRPDAIQQIEHGLATILGGYRSLGRIYRGIICSDLRQYVMLGDAAAMTDRIPGTGDDRWVFTENNPRRELQVAAGLAAAARVLKDHNPELAREALETALVMWESNSRAPGNTVDKVDALSELILATGDPELVATLVSLQESISRSISRCGWAVGHVIHMIDDASFRTTVAGAVKEYQARLQKEQATDSPYGVPYKPNIWGAGWTIQEFGVEQYFFHKGWPELTSTDFFENALHFILGVHPGSNNASFVSGVGSESIRVAYGVNRADWSFIPGGVVSGTALIRPDLPELKTWPYLWQQTEYVMGGGATNYMFLILAVDSLYR